MDGGPDLLLHQVLPGRVISLLEVDGLWPYDPVITAQQHKIISPFARPCFREVRGHRCLVTLEITTYDFFGIATYVFWFVLFILHCIKVTKL